MCVCVCVCVCVYNDERVYVNKSNSDSYPFKIYFAANGSSWLNG